MNFRLPTLPAGLANRRTAVMVTLGFSSGLPLALTGGTLQAWLTRSGVDTGTIAAFSLVGLPYTLKFLWSPLMDRFVPPLLGRRRGWMLLTQVLLMLLIAALAGSDPRESLERIAVLALFIAFLSASQDIAIDAYRADLLSPAERGFGAALSVAGYRTAMLVSGGLALIIAQYLGWSTTYGLMAGLLVIGALSAVFGPDPAVAVSRPATLVEAVVEPFRSFMSRDHALHVLGFIVFYKLGDAFAGTLTTTFLLRDLHFSLAEVGLVNKWLGFAATIAGGLAGGAMVPRYGLFRCLLWFGVLQAVTNLGFMILALIPPSFPGMVIAVGLENLAGGMGTAVFVALLIALCDHRFTATQFALLSALAAVGRVLVGPAAGMVAASAGWAVFFGASVLAAVPGIILLVLLRPQVEQYASR